MSMKQKIFNFFDNLLFSSVFLWAILIVLNFYNLKPEIIILFFFLVFLTLFLILYFRETLLFIIPRLNSFNCYLKSTEKLPVSNFLTKRELSLIFLIQFILFTKRFPQLSKFLLTNNYFWLILTVYGIFFDIFIFKLTSDFLIFLLLCLLIILIIRFKFKGRLSVGLALGFLILCPLLIIIKKELIAEKTAIWAYIFLAIGTIQLFLENSKDSN